MQLKQGVTIANRYVIAEVIGKGGMAIVYKARDIKLDRDVTLKVMREEFVQDDEFINRFNIEAKAAAKLTHQNIVNVFDVGKYGDIYFIVMEYIDGVTLKDIIKRRGALSNEEILGVSIQIAQALEVAHKNNIVHRDIKPQNILINAKGDVKVTDFGIARAINANTITSGNNTMGSVHYFSPEQARGGYIDQKSDIYSLGITMYEMATGELPFDDETVVAIALKHISEPLPNISYRNESISSFVSDVIEKATQKLGVSRFDTIEDMNNSLKRALINIGREKGDVSTAQPIVADDVKPIFSPEQANTLVLSDDDITEIRTKAMTAFFNNEEMDVSGMMIDNNNEKQKRPKMPKNDDFYDEEEKSGKKFIIGGILCAMLLSLIIAIGVFNYINNANELVEVPDFVGMTVEEAIETAKPYRITVEVDSKRYDDDYEEGEIIEQNYVSGQDKINVGGTIKVITSLGHEETTVPDVVGYNIDDAFEKIDEAGFDIEYKYEYAEGSDINTVQKQVPEAGTIGESGDTITIYISRGEESSTTFVPSLVGKSENSAKSAIGQNELSVGSITYDYNNDYAEGEVFAQSPKSGIEVQEYSTVNLFVSKGPAPKDETTEEPEEDIDSEDGTDTDTGETDQDGTDETTDNTGETTTENQTSTKTFTVNPISGLNESDLVSIKFVKISSDGSATVAYENTVNGSDLPLTVSIEGTGQERIQLSTKINDGPYQLQADTNVNFGE